MEGKNGNIIPVYFKFDMDNVSNDSHLSSVEVQSYKTNLTEKTTDHLHYNNALIKSKYQPANISPQTESSFEEHQKSYNRYTTAYENNIGQVELQMRYELGMGPNDMNSEKNIVSYLMKHKLIKFGNVNDTNNDVIDLNDHLEDNEFKYICHWSDSDLVFETNHQIQTIEEIKLKIRDLSSGERIYFNLLLWSLIHKINKKLLKEGHKGLVRNGAKFVFLLGKIL